ncbi:MAG: ParA family protein [Clostridia bacterium]|nr:ParA family protein [Clostridia bacterium]
MMDFASPRLTVLVGNYGSGKTELSLNIALHLAQQGQQTALVDLDIVNPYFRSGEKKAELEAAGIRVLMPSFAMTTVDVPALPPEIQSVFDRPQEHVVFDVGGDDTGAAALGRYAPAFAREEKRCLLVVNAMRPLTGTVEDILDLMHRIALRSRMTIDGLVNNANLGRETDAACLITGHELLKEVSKQSGVPYVMACAEKQLIKELPEELQAMTWPLTRLMEPEWMA